MDEKHRAYLSLGSNIEPEENLRQAIHMLRNEGQLCALSTVWENHALGAPDAPNFLNACAALITELSAPEFLEKVIRPIEHALGRTRNEDKNSARPIDIDIILFDDQPMRLEYWQHAFMIVPLAEIVPDFTDPLTGKPLEQAAQEARRREWMLARPEVLRGA